MPVVPMNIDSSTVAVTSMITAAITFFFGTTVLQLKPSVALAIAIVVGFTVNAIGVIPIGLLIVVGILMIVAIFNAIASVSTSGWSNSEKERRRTLGYSIASLGSVPHLRRASGFAMMRTLYDVLEISQTATNDTLQSIYEMKAKTLQLSIDAGNADAATELWSLKEAYAVLSNPTKRAEYDKKLANKHLAEDRSITPTPIIKGENRNSIFCNKCGAATLADAKLCSSCGGALNQISPINETPPAHKVATAKFSDDFFTKLSRDDYRLEKTPAQNVVSNIPKGQQIFIFGELKLSPHKYGEGAVIMSTQSATELIKTILNNVGERPAGDSIYTRMKSRPRLAQLQVMAVHIATYYVYALAVLQVPRSVLADVYRGITDDIGSWLSDPAMADWMESLVRTYSQVLFSEIQSPAEDIGDSMSFGTTAQLAVEQIKESYAQCEEFKDKKPLEVMAIDVVLMQVTIKTSVLGLLKAFREMKVAFAP